MVTTILPGLLCAAELIAVWVRTHSVSDLLADVPAIDGTAVLLTLI